MQLFSEIFKAIRICLFDRDAIKETSKNLNSTYISLAILIGGLASGIYVMFRSGAITLSFDVYVLTVVVILIISFWLIHNLAAYFKSKKSFLEFFRPAGYSNLLSLLFLLRPYLGSTLEAVIFIWSISLSVVIVKEVYELTYKRTFIIIGLFLLIGSMILIALSIFLGFLLYSRGI